MAKKPLRAIAEKGDKKLLSDKLKGVNKSTTEPLDLEDLVMSPEGNKATVEFGKKYNKIQKHDDRVGNTDVPYKSKGKESPYPSADAKMYEAADCSCDDDKDSCAVHGKGSKKLLLGDKKAMKENVEFSTLDTTPGLVPSGMQSVAKNLWNKADNHLTGPTVATGQGRPFIAKLGDEIKQLQKEAVENMNNQLDEKLTDEAKSNIQKALGAKSKGNVLRQTSMPVRALISLAKTKKENIKEEELKGNQKKLDKNHNGKLDKQDFKILRKEETIDEVAPPSKNSEEWIKKNKSRFTKEYGKDKGERVLYGKAWNDYKEKH
jgi:hypothetical protein